MAFISTLVIGLCTHIYKFTNTLPNHDSLFNFYSDQNVLGMGRWLLSIACGASSYFDLPWVNGLLSLLFIAATAAVVISVLEVKNVILVVIISGILVTFPGVTETFFFEFTADGYMLAMLLASLAVYFSRIGDNNIKHLILSAIFICMSCGIYQAYVSFALVLALCYFMQELLEDRRTLKEYFAWIKNQVIVYVSGLLAYLLIWKICMIFQNVQVNAYQGYQGIANVGQISIPVLCGAVKNTIKTWFVFLLEWNVLEHGWTLYGILNVIFILFALSAIIVAIYKSKLYQKKIQSVLFGLCLFALPFFCCIWCFTSSGVTYGSRMLQSIAVFYAWIMVLIAKWWNVKLKNIAVILIMIIIFNFGISANISYYLMNKCYETSYATANEMMMRIHLLDNGCVKKVAVVGNRGTEVSLDTTELGNRVHTYGACLESNLLFDQEHTILFLKNMSDFEYEVPTTEELVKIERLDEVQQMSVWPFSDSMKLINDTIVIKLAEPNLHSTVN